MKVYLMSVILILVMASSGLAITNWDGSESDDWSVADNWDAGVPTATDEARINNGSVVVYSGTDALAGGTTDPWNGLIMSFLAGTSADLDVQAGGSLTTSAGTRLCMGWQTGTTTILTVGGTVNVGGYLQFDRWNNGGHTGTVNINGGWSSVWPVSAVCDAPVKSCG